MRYAALVVALCVEVQAVCPVFWGQCARFRVVTVCRVSSDYCFQTYECGVLVPGGKHIPLQSAPCAAATVCLTHVQLARTNATYEHVTCPLLRVDTQLQHLVTTPSLTPPLWSILLESYFVAYCILRGHTGLFAIHSRAPTLCRIFLYSACFCTTLSCFDRVPH